MDGWVMIDLVLFGWIFMGWVGIECSDDVCGFRRVGKLVNWKLEVCTLYKG